MLANSVLSQIDLITPTLCPRKRRNENIGDRLGKAEVVNVESVIAEGLWYFLPVLPVVCFFLF